MQSALALLNAHRPDLSSGLRHHREQCQPGDLHPRRTVVWGGGADSERKVAILMALLPTKAKVIDVVHRRRR